MSGAFYGKGPARRNRMPVAASASIAHFFSAAAAAPAVQLLVDPTESPCAPHGTGDFHWRPQGAEAIARQRRRADRARKLALDWVLGVLPEGACPVCHEQPNIVVEASN